MASVQHLPRKGGRKALTEERIQFNVRVLRATVETFKAIADSQGLGVRELLEQTAFHMGQHFLGEHFNNRLLGLSGMSKKPITCNGIPNPDIFFQAENQAAFLPATTFHESLVMPNQAIFGNLSAHWSQQAAEDLLLMRAYEYHVEFLPTWSDWLYDGFKAAVCRTWPDSVFNNVISCHDAMKQPAFYPVRVREKRVRTSGDLQQQVCSKPHFDVLD